jgi:hypothetical protein
MKKIIYALLLIFTTTVSSQITFTSIPSEKQLFGRDLNTDYGQIDISGYINIGDNYDLGFSYWGSGEPNNAPAPEDYAEIINSYGRWNDANGGVSQKSYVEYEGLIQSLGNLTYLGQYNGHSYFKNEENLTWQEAKTAAENLGGYLASLHTAEENSAVSSFNFFRGWIGLYHDTNSANYSEPAGGWKWVSPISSETTAYSEIKVEFLRNGTIVNTYNNTLTYNQNIANFNFQIPILAELAKYRVKIYVKDLDQQFLLIQDIDDLVAGDVFIVQGQSNAAAVMYNGSSGAYQNDYLRVYSGGYTGSSSVLSDDNWYYAQGDGNENSGGNAGQWGLALAKMIKDQLNVPVAIFNGAHGGQPISFFDRPGDYASSTNSNYGRLYHRLNKTGLKNHVRAILWSQGEADSFANGLSTSQYISEFENLMSYWQEDYSSLEKYYIFQTRDCNCGTISSGRKQIKEAQRQLAIENNNVNIMPTTGMQVHSDYCHYPFVNGYEKFALRIFPQVMKDIYGLTLQESIYAPMITDISLSGNILEIQTNSESLVSNNSNTSALINSLNNDFVFSDSSISIVNFQLDSGKLILNLNQSPSNNTTLSFIGVSSNLEDNITNGSGIELVSFSDLCISGNCDGSSGQNSTDQDKKPAIVFVENGNGDVFNGKIYASSVRGASRGGNGNSNDAFGNPGDWSVDFVVSEKTPEQAAQQHGGFTESGHPLYTGGDGNWSLIHEGMGAIGWGSFAANAYNRSSGLGSVSLGFSTIAGPQVGAAGGIDGGNVGQFSAGWGSRAIGNISTATGFRNTASGTSTVALGNYNYATGDSSIALGKENWAEGASTIAIGFKNHAAGAGSVALGQESVAWGTTNFTAGYQNIAGDINAPVGTAGSATAIGHGTFASGRSSFSANKYTSATNQASASLGLGTTADNFGMLAVGVNNAAGIGDTSIDPNDYGGYYYADGEYTGTNPGVAFVVGNGDVNSSTGRAGDNPSNAFIVNYDGSATLSGELTVESDTRLKTNITTLGNTLSKLLLIDGKSYTMKSNEAIEKIGLLAQEVQKAFPELVKQAGDAEGTLSINYQGMIPVLINAIKQQQIELQRLRDKLKIR